jgi:hypothetical protein
MHMAELHPAGSDLVISEVPGGQLAWLFDAPCQQTTFTTLLAALAFAHDCAHRSQVSVWLINDDVAWLVKSYRPNDAWPIYSSPVS